MRLLLCLILLVGALGGCSTSTPTAATSNPKERLPIEVEFGPEDALPKKGPPRR